MQSLEFILRRILGLHRTQTNNCDHESKKQGTLKIYAKIVQWEIKKWNLQLVVPQT